MPGGLFLLLWHPLQHQCLHRINPIALRKAKIVYNFGFSECNRVYNFGLSECNMGLKKLIELKVLTNGHVQIYKLQKWSELFCYIVYDVGTW